MIWLVIIGVVVFIWHCPVFKPYFGWKLRKWSDLGR